MIGLWYTDGRMRGTWLVMTVGVLDALLEGEEESGVKCRGVGGGRENWVGRRCRGRAKDF